MNYFITYKRTKAYHNVHSCAFHPAQEAKRDNPWGAPFVPLIISLLLSPEITTTPCFSPLSRNLLHTCASRATCSFYMV